MIEVRCPTCKRFLFNANCADVEFKCACKRLLKIRFFSQSSLVLTGAQKEYNIESTAK